MKIKTFVRTLPHTLTHEERFQAALDLAETINAISNKKSEQDFERQQMKATMTDLEGQREGLASVVASGIRYKETTCETHLDFENGVYYEVRLDTGELLVSRPLSDDERQRELPMEG